jgi:hypothetical protein
MHVAGDSNARNDSIPNARQMHVQPVTGNITNAFDYGNQLWRLEAYNEKKTGRTVVKRALRFVPEDRRVTKNIGEITPELKEALDGRPGKGRTTEARAEADRNRLLALSLAERHGRIKTGRGRNGSKRGGRKRKTHTPTKDVRRGVLPEVPDGTQHDPDAYMH